MGSAVSQLEDRAIKIRQHCLSKTLSLSTLKVPCRSHHGGSPARAVCISCEHTKSWDPVVSNTKVLHGNISAGTNADQRLKGRYL